MQPKRAAQLNKNFTYEIDHCGEKSKVDWCVSVVIRSLSIAGKFSNATSFVYDERCLRENSCRGIVVGLQVMQHYLCILRGRNRN